jgi:hypothetical protein
MSTACHTHGREVWGKSEENRLDVGGRIMLKLILEKLCGVVWTG